MQGQVVILLCSILCFVVFCVQFIVINVSEGVSSKGAINPVFMQYFCTRVRPQSLASCVLIKYTPITFVYVFVHLQSVTQPGRDPANVRILEGGSMNCAGQ